MPPRRRRPGGRPSFFDRVVKTHLIHCPQRASVEVHMPEALTYHKWQVRLVWSTYADNGRIALSLVSADEAREPIARITVNLPDAPVAAGCSFVKDYAEGEGNLKWLVDNKIAEPTGRTVRSGYVSIPEVKWRMWTNNEETA